jgi:hypothetical protein
MKAEEIKLALQKNSETHVQLGLAQDLEKANTSLNSVLKSADNSWKEYQNYLTRADVPFKKMIGEYNKLSSLYSSSESILSKIKASAKDLGIEPTQLKDYNTFVKNIETAKEIFNVISSFKDPSSFQ